MKDQKDKKPDYSTRFQPGNTDWKKAILSGRKKKFKTKTEALSKIYSYFDWCNNNKIEIENVSAGKIVKSKVSRPYSIIGLCNYLGINYTTFLTYENEETHSEFNKVFTHAREVIEENQLTGAMIGQLSGNIIARLLGLADKKSIAVADQRKSIDELFPPIEEIVEGVDLTEEPE